MRSEYEEPERRIAQYLLRLDRALVGIPASDRSAILRELRGHLVEHAENGGGELDAALQRLGSPEALARTYCDELALAAASPRGFALRLLVRRIARGARGVSRAVMVTLAGIVYLFAFAGWLIAGAKLVVPENVGAWFIGGHLHTVGIVSAPPLGGTERLGYAIIPLACLFATLLHLAANQTRGAAHGFIPRGTYAGR